MKLSNDIDGKNDSNLYESSNLDNPEFDNVKKGEFKMLSSFHHDTT